MSAATAVDPLTRRADLEAEIERIDKTKAEHNGRLDELEAEIKDTKWNLATALEEAARTGDDEKAPILRQKVSDLEAERIAVREARDGANQALGQSRERLKHLLREHFEVFAKQCEATTQEALAELRSFKAAYGAALKAWDAAVNAWRPLVDAAPIAPNENPRAPVTRTLTVPPPFPVPFSSFLKAPDPRSLVPRPKELTTPPRQKRRVVIVDE